MELSLSYQDVFLLPRYSTYYSRDSVKTEVTFGPRTFKLPIVPANMACVIDINIARWMSENDYFYIMHLFNNGEGAPNQDNWEFLKTANREQWKTISVSLGVQETDRKFLLDARYENLRIDYLTLDIAHAHSVRMKEMLKLISEMYWIGRPFVIAGNIATSEAVKDLEAWGVDAIKVGIAQGGACTTYGMTGFGTPMFTCMLHCAGVATKPLIADGGIKTDGDIAKAIRAGASMVMAGSFFAACKDSPAENIYNELEEHTDHLAIDNDVRKITHKKYYGSASIQNKHNHRHVEGTLIKLECNHLTYEQKLLEIKDSYQSSLSYAGGDLNKVKWGIRR